MAPLVFPEASALGLLRTVRTVRWVQAEELMPTAVLERHWEKLLQRDTDAW